jgi:DNA polymerase III delta prime subunit
MHITFLQKQCAWVELLLQRQVLRLRRLRDRADDRFRGLYIADAEIDELLSPGEASSSAAISNLSFQIDLLEADMEEQLATSPGLPLARLMKRVGPSPLECRILALAVAPDLDLRFQTLLAYVQNDVTRKAPTVDLALKVLCATREEQWSARTIFSPRAPLFLEALLSLEEDRERDSPLLAKSMRVPKRVVDFLLEHNVIASALDGIAVCIQPRPDMPCLRELHAAAPALRNGGVVILHGRPGSGRCRAAEAVSHELSLNLLICDLQRAHDLAGLGTLLRRECLLSNAALYLKIDEAAEPDGRRPLSDLVRTMQDSPFPVFIGTGAANPAIPPAAVAFHFHLALPEIETRRALWQQALNGSGSLPELQLEIPTLAGKFRFTPGQIRDVVTEAHNLARLRGIEDETLAPCDIYSAARVHGKPGLEKLAQKCELIFSWQDLVLPERVLEQLREATNSVRFRHVVHSEWGFDSKVGKNAGITIMFSGLSGTGKTMAASVIARELNFDLYKIDLSSVTSKYVGETEKNLCRLFDEAEYSSAVLFFDEADALFGKRSEVKDAHDRFANLEVAFLLQKIEQFPGFSILATNISRNIDTAFMRRMQHVIEFPFPDAMHRERIWRGMFPPRAPIAADVDFTFLARQFELSGGNIRNIVTAAAFLAAAQDCPVSMEHLARATGREYQKMGRLPSKADFQEHFSVISAMVGDK